jgi:hypothetical protein
MKLESLLLTLRSETEMDRICRTAKDISRDTQKISKREFIRKRSSRDSGRRLYEEGLKTFIRKERLIHEQAQLKQLESEAEVEGLFHPEINPVSSILDPGHHLRNQIGTHQLLYEHSYEKYAKTEQLKRAEVDREVADCHFDMIHTLPMYQKFKLGVKTLWK